MIGFLNAAQLFIINGALFLYFFFFIFIIIIIIMEGKCFKVLFFVK